MQIVDEMVASAGPGGQHAGTLLLVWGDHGQTDAGDHGGGSAPEVDSALVAIDLAALHALRRGGSGSGSGSGDDIGSGIDNSGSGDGRNTDVPEEPEAAATAAAAADKQCSSSAVDSAGLPLQQCWAGQQSRGEAWPVLPQVDFAPSLAALLGVPIPFGSIGRISRPLWHLRGCNGQASAADCRRRYAAALQANAWQVQRYLDAYAASDGGDLPKVELQRSRALYEAAASDASNEASDELVAR